MVINRVGLKVLPEQLGFHRYAVNTRPDELSASPLLKKDPPLCQQTSQDVGLET